MRIHERLVACECIIMYRCVPFETSRKAEEPRFHKVLIISLLNAMVSVHSAMIVSGLLLASLAASEPQREVPK